MKENGNYFGNRVRLALNPYRVFWIIQCYGTPVVALLVPFLVLSLMPLLSLQWLPSLVPSLIPLWLPGLATMACTRLFPTEQRHRVPIFSMEFPQRLCPPVVWLLQSRVYLAPHLPLPLSPLRTSHSFHTAHIRSLQLQI